MKKFAFLALFLSLGLLTVGCKPTDKKPATTPAAGTDSMKPVDDTKPVDETKPVEKPADDPK